jgi:hypothetical protein
VSAIGLIAVISVLMLSLLVPRPTGCLRGAAINHDGQYAGLIRPCRAGKRGRGTQVSRYLAGFAPTRQDVLSEHECESCLEGVPAHGAGRPVQLLRGVYVGSNPKPATTCGNSP